MSRPGEIVRTFLLQPRLRSNFDPFFELCHATAVGFLRYCHSRGYQLPLHRADLDAAYSDLATTLLGELFRSEPGKPFTPIFGYFRRHNLTNYESVDAGELHRHFKILICGHIKKQLFRLRKTENSQAEILKRRIKDILRPPEYLRIESGYNEPTRVTMARWADNLRENAAPITADRLQRIVEEAYLESQSRAQWCQNVFRLLNAETDLRNFVYINDLLAVMVSTNADALQELLPALGRRVSTESEILQRAVNRVVDQTVDWARYNVIADFVGSRRIEVPEGRAYCRALENYLLDLSHCGDTDSIPQYFREVMPPARHDSYLTRYKYTFETTINRSLEYFREKLKEQTT